MKLLEAFLNKNVQFNFISEQAILLAVVVNELMRIDFKFNKLFYYYICIGLCV